MKLLAISETKDQSNCLTVQDKQNYAKSCQIAKTLFMSVYFIF